MVIASEVDMVNPSRLSDEIFAEPLTSREAYLCMYEFLRAHYERGPWDEIGQLLSNISLLDDDSSADPAMIHDWLDAVTNVREAEVAGGYTDAKLRFK